MREIKQQLHLRWDELLLIPMSETFLFVFGEIMMWFIIKNDSKDTIVDLGTLLTIVVTCAILIFFESTALPLCFNTAISMGSTRRRLIPLLYFITFLECIVAFIYAYLLNKLELWVILPAFDSGLEIESVTEMFFQLKYILPAAFGIAAINSLFGTLVLKYGKIALIIMWALWTFGFTAIPRIIRSLDSYQHTVWGRAVLSFLNNITEFRLILCACICSIIVLLISWLMLRRQQVKM